MADKKTKEEIDEALKESQAAEASHQKKMEGIKDADEKKILILYNKGVQNYQIAKEVYKFVNADTVGTVIGVIRKYHAEDYDQVEDLNSYKGYSGV